MPVSATAFVNGEDADQDTFNLRLQETLSHIDDGDDGSRAMASPAVTSFTNAQHNHEDAAGGGQIALAALSQSSASTGQVPQWNGSAWAAATVDLTEVTAKGDLISHNGTDPTRLAVGTNGAPLVADSAQTVGLKYGGANYKYFEHEGVKVYNSNNQTVPNATPTILTWDSETFDDSGYHDTGSNTSRLTALQTGRYRVTFALLFNATNSTTWDVKIKKNGSTDIYTIDETVEINLQSPQALTVDVELTQNDYIEIEVTHTTTSITVQGTSTKSFFGMDYLGTI